MPIDPSKIVMQARTWLDTPFRHQGRIKGVGVDCGGLLLGVGRELGIEVIEPPAYSMSPDPAIFPVALARYCDRILIVDRQPGDIGWFSFAGDPRHVGIFTDLGLIHAWAKPGKVVEHGVDATWLRRLREVWRIR